MHIGDMQVTGVKLAFDWPVAATDWPRKWQMAV